MFSLKRDPVAPSLRPRLRITSVAFVAFLLVVLVGFNPFPDRRLVNDFVGVAEGDALKQVFTIIPSLIIFYFTFFRYKHQLRSVGSVLPAPMLLLIAWCALSLLWSPVPFVGLRRLALAVLILLVAFSVVRLLGVEHTLKTIYRVIVITVALSVVLGAVYPDARHPSYEIDQNLVGAWRGIFGHKNMAGVAGAICVIFSSYYISHERRWIHLVPFCLAIVLLILSRSKASLGLLIPSASLGVFIALRSRSHRRFLYSFAGAFCGTSILVCIYVAWNNILNFMMDPSSLTGRVGIWQQLAIVVKENPWLGVGYGSLYQTGEMDVFSLYSEGWVANVASGHNGYLDLIATVGYVGIAVVLYAAFASPLSHLRSISERSPQIAYLLAAFLCFAFLHNFFESSLLRRDHILWVILSFVCAVAYGQRSASRKKKS